MKMFRSYYRSVLDGLDDDAILDYALTLKAKQPIYSRIRVEPVVDAWVSMFVLVDYVTE